MNYGAFEFRGVARVASAIGIVAALGLGGCDGDDDGGVDMVAGTSMTTIGMDDGSGSETGMGDDGADSGTSGGMTMCEDFGDLSHAADIQPLWDQYCVEGCHEPMGEWASNDLSGDAYPIIVGMQSAQNSLMNFVTAGDPAQSYLLHKMKGTQVDAGGSGLDMPKARVGMPAEVVPECDIAKIEEWINQGAPM